MGASACSTTVDETVRAAGSWCPSAMQLSGIGAPGAFSAVGLKASEAGDGSVWCSEPGSSCVCASAWSARACVARINGGWEIGRESKPSSLTTATAAATSGGEAAAAIAPCSVEDGRRGCAGGSTGVAGNALSLPLVLGLVLALALPLTSTSTLTSMLLSPSS